MKQILLQCVSVFRLGVAIIISMPSWSATRLMLLALPDDHYMKKKPPRLLWWWKYRGEKSKMFDAKFWFVMTAITHGYLLILLLQLAFRVK